MIPRIYLYIAAALLIAAAFGGTYWKGHSNGVEATGSKYSASLAAAQSEARQKERTDAADATKRESARLTQIRELETRVAALVRAQSQRPIRLCQPAGGGVSAAGAATADTAGGTSGDRSAVRAGNDPVSAGPDLSSDLVRYGAQCESDRQQLIALQSWLKAAHEPIQ